MRTIIILLVACFSLAFSCERDTEEVLPANTGDLTGSWKLTEPASSYKITLIVERNTKTSGYGLTGQSSVNQYFATAPDPNLIFSSTPNPLLIESLGSTKIAGSADAMQFEQTYFNNLRNVNRYELTTQNRLRLYYGGSQAGVLVYEKTK